MRELHRGSESPMISQDAPSFLLTPVIDNHTIFTIRACHLIGLCLSSCLAVFSSWGGGREVRLWAAPYKEAEVLGTDCGSCVWSSFLLPAVQCHRPTLGWKSMLFICTDSERFILKHVPISQCFHCCLPIFVAEDVWCVCASEVRGLVCHSSPAGVWRCDSGLWAGAAWSSWLCAFQRGQDTTSGGFQL